MKSIHLFITILLGLTLLPAATQPNQYEAAMAEAIEQLYQAQSAEALQAAGNAFERIAKKETDKWHPLYYAAYAQIMLTTRTQESNRQDSYLDVALQHLNTAKELSTDNSELLALEGFIHMLRIPIDPATRGPQYSGLSMGALQKAVALNPENPRAQLILAEMQYGTAQFFGSDSEEACRTMNKAIELFETAEPESKLDPAWGKEWAEQSKAQKGC